MIIDLSSVLEKDDYIKNYQAKSKIIMNNLKGYENGYILIISINILNILEMDDRFIDVEYEKILSGDIFKGGDICGFECYVDKYMKSDEILITYNKVKMRDNKIDYLLNNDNLVKEKRVKIIS
jgi:hypothetical protein